MKTLQAVTAAALATTALTTSPAYAATTVYTDQAAFNNAHPGAAFHAFPFSEQADPQTTYSQDGLTVTSSNIFTLQDSAYANAKYLDFIFGNTATFTSNQYSAYGFNLGSFSGPQTINYVVNGLTGTLALGDNRATSFIGFDLGSSTSLNAIFNFESELDVVSGFQTASAVTGAVPEPATWLTMILGMGAVGSAMRRRKKVTTRVSFAA